MVARAPLVDPVLSSYYGREGEFVLTVIAILRNTEIINQIVFNEPSQNEALTIAKEWLERGVFDSYQADSVEIVKCDRFGTPETSIGNYLIDGIEIPARHFVRCDETHVVIDTYKHPESSNEPIPEDFKPSPYEASIGDGFVDGVLTRTTQKEQLLSDFENRLVERIVEVLNALTESR